MKKYRKILLCCSVVLIGAVTAVTYRSFADSNNDRNTDISDVAEIKKDLSQLFFLNNEMDIIFPVIL